MTKNKRDYYTMTVAINEEEISCMTITKKEYEKQLSRFDDVMIANHADNEREFEYSKFDDTYRYEDQHYTMRKTLLNCGLTDIVLRHYYCDEGYSFKK